MDVTTPDLKSKFTLYKNKFYNSDWNISFAREPCFEKI
jgi:hypothetical protein